MDEPEGYHAQWNMSDRERQMLYDLIYMWNLKKKIQQTSEYNKTEANSQI